MEYYDNIGINTHKMRTNYIQNAHKIGIINKYKKILYILKDSHLNVTICNTRFLTQGVQYEQR